MLVLGDVTDAKDEHSAALVNRVVSSFNSLVCDDVRILCGNHDWLRQGQEFFKFLNLLPHVQFITEPTEDDEACGPLSIFMPYSKTPAKDWKDYNFGMFDMMFMHQTIKGAVASNGQAMEGEALPALDAARVYSGDIHVPQIKSGITYVGSPYHVHVGDDFTPRCLLIDKDWKETSLYFPSIKRVALNVTSVSELRKTKLSAGDQVRVRVELAESDKHGWAEVRKKCMRILEDKGVCVLGVELCLKQSKARLGGAGKASEGVLQQTPDAVVYSYVQTHELGGDLYQAAAEIMESV